MNSSNVQNIKGMLTDGKGFASFISKLKKVKKQKQWTALSKVLEVISKCVKEVSFLRHSQLIELLVTSVFECWRTSGGGNEGIEVIGKLMYLNEKNDDLVNYVFRTLVVEIFKGGNGTIQSHKILQYVFSKSESVRKTFVSVAKASFSSLENIGVRTSYIKNLLKIGFYESKILRSIIELIVDDLIHLDLQIKLSSTAVGESTFDPLDEEDDDAIEELSVNDMEDEIVSLSFDQCFEDDDLSDDELDLVGMKTDQNKSVPGISSSKARLLYEKRMFLLAEKVDHTMEVFFQFFRYCSTKSGYDFENLFSNFQKIFFSRILKTYALNSTQFLMFYLSSLNEKYSFQFVKELLNWSIVIRDLQNEVRKTTLSYLASFLSRANFLSPKLIYCAVNKLLSFCCSKGKIDSQLFYYVVQAVFYVLCYKIKQIKKNVNMKMIDAIIKHDLKPLKYIPIDVVSVVIKLFKSEYNIDYRSYVAENHDSRLVVDYFPFDPYILRKSKTFIEPIFEYWSGDTEDKFTPVEQFSPENVVLSGNSFTNSLDDKIISGSLDLIFNSPKKGILRLIKKDFEEDPEESFSSFDESLNVKLKIKNVFGLEF